MSRDAQAGVAVEAAPSRAALSTAPRNGQAPGRRRRPACLSSSKSRSIRQRSLAVATSSSIAAVAGRVESQYLVGSVLPSGHSMRNHSSGCGSARVVSRAMRGTNPKDGKARAERPRAALTPGDASPRARRQRQGQLFGRERLVRLIPPPPLGRSAPARPSAAASRRSVFAGAAGSSRPRGLGRQRSRAGRPQGGRALDAGHIGKVQGRDPVPEAGVVAVGLDSGAVERSRPRPAAPRPPPPAGAARARSPALRRRRGGGDPGGNG
jgi:hypothetical protein